MSDALSSSSPKAQRGPTTTPLVAGRYRVLEALGSGGMATVVRADDTVAGRHVALKQLREGIAKESRPTFDALFAREYHTLARLSHRRIVQVYDYGIADGLPYYTMELLDRQDLKDLAPLDYKVACRHLRDVASSLALIHAHRLVHRDVSPRNVRIAADGSAKLIDFGALASFGIAHQVIGTPPCIAPEVFRHMPLDQRTDLYALGAVAYYVLTGRHAYPARSIQELKVVWRNTPPPPSRIVAGIPPALDALVLSLLSDDPSTRPSNAAIVIDQLTSIAGLEPEELEHTGESYLSSSRMVGREADVQWLRKELLHASNGKGRAILFEGATGIGKTRLLHELCLEAQLQGAHVVKVDAQSHSAPFGVASALMAGLLRDWPEVASRLGRQHVNLLAQLSPSVREQLPNFEPVGLSEDPSERRARFQLALQECFVKAARDQVLFLAIDNLHAADDNSVALLATLASEAPQQRLILLCTQRTGATVNARGSVEALRKRSSCVRLRNLPAAACGELVRSLFGEAANTGRLARLLHVHSAGNPQQCMDLVRLLVKRNIAKYVGGTWVLPLDIADDLPSQFNDILEQRIASLNAPARSLAEALSVYARPIQLARALAIAAVECGSQEAAHTAIDELLDEEILRQEGDALQFSHADSRDVIWNGVDAERRRALHGRAAELLLADAGNAIEKHDAAWHLLLAGEEMRGAALLIETVHDHMRVLKLEPESYDQIAESLLAALDVYDKQGRGPHELAEILFPLMSIGFLADWRIAEAHGRRAIEVGLDITGLALAHRLRPKIGAKVAIGAGLATGLFRFVGHGSDRDRLGLPSAIENFCAIIPPTIAAWTIRYDHVGAERLIELLEPLRYFGPRHPTTLMYDYGVAQLRMVQGRVREARELLAQILPRFEDPKVTRLVGDVHLRLLKGGVLFATGILAGIACDNRELEIAAQLEALDIQLWAMGAEQVRALHHADRGESPQVEHHLNRVELFAIRGGSTWQADLFWPFLLLPSHLDAGDRLGARRCVEQLELRAREAPSLKVYAELGRAAYLTLRGEISASIALFEQNEAFLKSAVGVAWNVLRTWFANALIAGGQHQRAKDLMLDTLAILGPDHEHLRREQIMSRRVVAHAEAGMGNYAEAVSIIDGLLAAHGALDQPLVIGLLHKTRAELALVLHDRVAFELHAAEMERRFTATHNSALISQWERLMRSAAAAEPEWPHKDQAPEAHSELQLLSQLSLAGDRYESALRLILHRSRAKAAHLYWTVNGELALVASTGPGEPSTELQNVLRRRLAREQQELREQQVDAPAEHMTVLERSARRLRGAPSNRPKSGPVAGAPAPRLSVGAPPEQSSSQLDGTDTLLSSHDILPLRSRRDKVILGGVILEMPLVVGEALDVDFVEGVTAALSELSSTEDALTVLEP